MQVNQINGQIKNLLHSLKECTGEFNNIHKITISTEVLKMNIWSWQILFTY